MRYISKYINHLLRKCRVGSLKVSNRRNCKKLYCVLELILQRTDCRAGQVIKTPSHDDFSRDILRALKGAMQKHRWCRHEICNRERFCHNEIPRRGEPRYYKFENVNNKVGEQLPDQKLDLFEVCNRVRISKTVAVDSVDEEAVKEGQS